MHTDHVVECERYLDPRAACTCPLPEELLNDRDLERLRLRVRDKALDTTMSIVNLMGDFFKSLKK